MLMFNSPVPLGMNHRDEHLDLSKGPASLSLQRLRNLGAIRTIAAPGAPHLREQPQSRQHFPDDSPQRDHRMTLASGQEWSKPR